MGLEARRLVLLQPLCVDGGTERSRLGLCIIASCPSSFPRKGEARCPWPQLLSQQPGERRPFYRRRLERRRREVRGTATPSPHNR